MTTFIMGVGDRAPRFGARALRPLTAAGLSVAFLLTAASSAPAAGSSVYAHGLHISTGALVDPDGRTWISDHNAGLCRVTDPSPWGPGHIEHPQFPGDTAHGDPTCLGGLLPGAGIGPDAAQSAVAYENTDTGEHFAARGFKNQCCGAQAGAFGGGRVDAAFEAVGAVASEGELARGFADAKWVEAGGFQQDVHGRRVDL